MEDDMIAAPELGHHVLKHWNEPRARGSSFHTPLPEVPFMLNSSRPIYQTPAWDRAFSVVLLVITFIVAMTGSFFALVSIMGSAVCGPNECDTNIMNVGLFIAGFLPWPVFLAAIAFTITAIIRRRRGVWVSLAGLIFVLTTGAVGIGLIVSQTLNAHH